MPRFATNRDRVLNTEAVDAAVEAWTSLHKRDDITGTERGLVPSPRVRTLAEIADDEELVRSGTWQDIDHPGFGAVRVLASAVRPSAGPCGERTAAHLPAGGQPLPTPNDGYRARVPAAARSLAKYACLDRSAS